MKILHFVLQAKLLVFKYKSNYVNSAFFQGSCVKIEADYAKWQVWQAITDVDGPAPFFCFNFTLPKQQSHQK